MVFIRIELSWLGTMSGFGKTVQLSLTRNATNELLVDLNGEIWTFDMMGLFSPVETLGLTFEQYMEDHMVDTYNWMTLIVIALDIAYGVATMATGGAPLLIGLAPVTITLILASLYYLMWYYIFLPFGTAYVANDANNFETKQEQDEFNSKATDFITDLRDIHALLMAFNLITIRGSKVKEVITELIVQEVPNIIPTEFLRKLVSYGIVVANILMLIQTIYQIISNPHLQFLMIDVIISILGMRYKLIGIVMLLLNLIATIFFSISWMFITFF